MSLVKSNQLILCFCIIIGMIGNCIFSVRYGCIYYVCTYINYKYINTPVSKCTRHNDNQ